MIDIVHSIQMQINELRLKFGSDVLDGAHIKIGRDALSEIIESREVDKRILHNPDTRLPSLISNGDTLDFRIEGAYGPDVFAVCWEYDTNKN